MSNGTATSVLRETMGRQLDRVVTGVAIPAVMAWFAAASIIVPSALVMGITFVPGLVGDVTFTLGNYAEVLSSRYLPTILFNTVLVGVGTSLVVAFFAVPMAWLLQRTDLPLKSVLTTCVVLIVLIPTFLKGMGWIMLLSPRIGIINELLRAVLGLSAGEGPLNIYGIPGVVFVQGLSLTPSMLFLILGAMRSLDPALEEAAETAGATRYRTLMRVSFPLVRPAVLGGFIYTFMTAISLYEIPALLGGESGQVLSTELFSFAQPDSGLPQFGLAGVYGLLIVIPSLVALYFYFRVIRRGHRYAVVTGKGYRPKLVELGGWKYLALSFILFYLVLAAGLPFLVLVWVSLLPGLAMPSVEALSRVSLDQYGRIFSVALTPEIVGNTLMFFIAEPLFVVFFSFMISWVVVRSNLRGRQFLDSIAMLPHAIPGLVFAFSLAVAAILLSVWFGLQLHGSIALIIAASAINRLSYGTRLTNAALLQVHAELEEAAEISGAKKYIVMWRIMIPIIRPSLSFLFLWSALHTLREVSIPLMLSGPHNRVLSVQIWKLWDSGATAEAATAGVLLIGVMGLLIVAAQRLLGLNLQRVRTG